MCHCINLQKCTSLPFFLFLQYYYDNWSVPMCLYTCLHGSYGLLWYLKHLIFPDASFEDY